MSSPLDKLHILIVESLNPLAKYSNFDEKTKLQNSV